MAPELANADNGHQTVPKSAPNSKSHQKAPLAKQTKKDPKGHLSYPELGPHLVNPDHTPSKHNPDHTQGPKWTPVHGWLTYTLGTLH